MNIATSTAAPATEATTPPPLSRADDAVDGVARNGAEREAALEAARAFEKLLIHDMLKTMRRTAAVLGEPPSNARSTYDDMLDERLAGIMSEGGGLGLAETLAGQLAPGTGRDAAARPAAPPANAFVTADLLRLRSLVRPADAGADTDPARTAAGTAVAGTARAASTAGGIAPHTLLSSRATDREDDVGRERREFIEPLLPHARVSARRLGTSPDAVLAVAALESGWGRHVMQDRDGRSSHNLFGIKARPGEPGAVSAATDEYVDGVRHRVVAEFRSFPDRGSAVNGFADFVLDNPRYATALEHAADPPEFLRRLQAAGYATDPRYADKAIAVMQRIRVLRENLS